MGHHSFLTQPVNAFLHVVDDCKGRSFISGHDRQGVDQAS